VKHGLVVAPSNYEKKEGKWLIVKIRLPEWPIIADLFLFNARLFLAVVDETGRYVN
jgi:hypothetical protein